MQLDFHDDPRPFLAAAGDLLAAEPVLGSVIATVTERQARLLEAGETADVPGLPVPPWWVVVRDASGEAFSASMRTAPFEPFPTFSLPMSAEAAVALARALHARGEFLGGANGALPGTEVLARETARLWGGSLVVGKATRLWECTDVVVPPDVPPGRLRRATEAEAPLVLAWSRAFHEEADEQAGREPDPASGEHNTLEDTLVRIREGVEWVWETPDGEIAHLSGSSLPSFGVGRVGPVFTPKEHRGRGLASYVVGELTRRGLEAGTRMCLFTDVDNPTSNKIYASLGYRPVTEMGEHLVIVPGT